MKLTAREIVSKWNSVGVSLVNIERVMQLPFGSLKEIYTTEGPAQPEMEMLLNMLHRMPCLIVVAEENFNLRKIIINLFDEWKTQQKEILEKLIIKKEI